MPQMAPLSWWSLYLMFSVTLILFCIMNYYSFTPTVSGFSQKSNPSIKSMNWKW